MGNKFRDAAKIWNQFCEFTSIAGFRFMSTKIAFSIRITALIIFVSSVIGLITQLVYLVGQYFEDQILISSRQEPLDIVPLPLIYICNALAESSEMPFLDVCKRRNPSDNSTISDEDLRRLSVKISQTYFTYCNFDVSYRDYSCDFRCKWTSNGFCLEARRGALTQFVPDSLISYNGIVDNTTNERTWDVKESRIFDIQVYFNARNPYTTVYLRSYTDPLTDRNEYVPLVGAPHIVMDMKALNTIQITEILNITHKELKHHPPTVSFEFCVWKEYSNLLSDANVTKCDRQIYTNFYSTDVAEFRNVRYGTSECTLQLAERAMKHCTDDKSFGRYEVETTRFINNQNTNNKINLRVFINEVISRSTLSTDRAHGFKLLSELGGSLSLYIGFTLMSLLEIGAFLFVPKVRQYAQIDEETMIQRKNPAIRNLPALLMALKLAVKDRCIRLQNLRLKQGPKNPTSEKNVNRQG